MIDPYLVIAVGGSFAVAAWVIVWLDRRSAGRPPARHAAARRR